MPPMRPQVRVRVVDPSANEIITAAVTLTSAAYPGGLLLPFDPWWHVYTHTGIPNGPCNLEVKAPGYIAQTRPAVLVGDSIETFVLARRPLPWYYRGWVRVPYDLPLMIAVAMKRGLEDDIDTVRHIPEHAGLHPGPFDEPTVEDSVHRQRVFVFLIPGNDAAMASQFEQLARAHSSVRTAGEVVRFTRRSVSFLTNEVILKLQPGASMPSIVDAEGFEHGRRLEWLDNTFLLRGRSSSGLSPTLERLNGDKTVMWAEPNFFSTITWHAPNDPLYGVQPHHVLIDSPSAWAVPHGTGDRSRMAVIDNGCDTAHEDLAPRIVGQYNFDHPGSAVDVGLNGHGTRAAGIAAAQIDNGLGVAGVAGMSELVPIQINATTHLEFAEMFLWCAGLIGAPDPGGALLAPAAAVLSNSWGIEGLAAGALSTSPWMGGLMAAVFDILDVVPRSGKGCVVVFSAGNDDAEFALLYPWAAYPKNVAVAASTTTAPEDRVPNSNYSVELDVCAPGGGLPPVMQGTTTTDVAAFNPFGSPYGDFGETSCACPQVAGAAALILSVSPEMPARSVRELLRLTALKIDEPSANPIAGYIGPSLSPTRFSRVYGYGRLRVGTAVRAAAPK